MCGPGGLRVPCAPVPGARSPAAGGEHQGEESGQLRPREQVRQAPRAGERTRKPIERSESGREHVRGVDCMGQRPGVGRMCAGCQKGSQRGGEEKQKRQQPRQNHHLLFLALLSARPRRRPAFIGAPCVTPPLCDVTGTSGQSPGGFHRCAPRANCGAVLSISLQSGPAPVPAGSLRPWGAGRCI